jgi:Flp pilus assembly protein TadD
MIAVSPEPTFARPPLELEGAAVRALTAVGFHGALAGKPKAALRLFEALGQLDPAAAHPRIGRALALIAAGRAAEAARALETAGEAEAGDDTIAAFLGLALQMAREERRAQAVLAAVAEKEDGDPQARKLARQLLAGPEEAGPAGALMSKGNSGE